MLKFRALSLQSTYSMREQHGPVWVARGLAWKVDPVGAGRTVQFHGSNG